VKKVTIYESSDGNRWESEQNCKEWEAFLPLLQRYAKEKNVKMLRRIESALYNPSKKTPSTESI
jgi:hypothetical protein